MKRIQNLIMTGIFGLTSLALAEAELPTKEEMWTIIQKQQQQIDVLQSLVESNQKAVSKAASQLATTQSESSAAENMAKTNAKVLAATQAQLEATTLAVESSGTNATHGWWNKTSIGGYGELHANIYENADNSIDFHRFVLFVNHDFNDWISLYSELEIEHSIAGDGQPGEIELEQAFIRMDLSERFSLDTGLFLMPVGILNETHEPNTFYGVERNLVEKNIIPTTWWEAGVKGTYKWENGMTLEGGLTSGLNRADGKIRSGRQKVAKAKFEETALSARVKYTGIPGLELAASIFYQADLAQGDDSVDYSGLLSTFHIDYSKGGFGLRALYAGWNLSGDIMTQAEEQTGYYIEPSYQWKLGEDIGDLGVYARVSNYDYTTGSNLSENTVYEAGVNYWPIQSVVLKLDIQDVSDSDELSGKGETIWNLGFGYHF